MYVENVILPSRKTCRVATSSEHFRVNAAAESRPLTPNADSCWLACAFVPAFVMT
jgi:hypothetical protein